MRWAQRSVVASQHALVPGWAIRPFQDVVKQSLRLPWHPPCLSSIPTMWRVSMGHDRAALRSAVMDIWDPIGVDDFPEAADEYDSYLPAILRELQHGTPESLSNYLHTVRTQDMALTRSLSTDRAAADRLFDWWLAQPSR